MEIVQKYLTQNPCYQAGKKIQVKGLMLHIAPLEKLGWGVVAVIPVAEVLETAKTSERQIITMAEGAKQNQLKRIQKGLLLWQLQKLC